MVRREVWALAGCAAAVAAASASAASAAPFYVVTNAQAQIVNTGADASYNGGASYNVSGVGSANPTGTSFTVNTISNGGPVSLIGIQNVPGNQPNATIASDTVSASLSGVTDTAGAIADIASGTIHGYAIDPATSPSLTPFSGASYTADLFDTLHFNAPGASGSTPVPITVHFSADGSFTQVAAGGTGFMHSDLLMGGGPEVIYDLDLSADTGFETAVTAVNDFGSGGFSTATASKAEFVDTFNLTDPSQTVTVALDMNAGCGHGMICNFGDTAGVSFDLPAGVTFTSDSGVFLTDTGAPSSGIPEPGSFTFLAMGLLGLSARHMSGRTKR